MEKREVIVTVRRDDYDDREWGELLDDCPWLVRCSECGHWEPYTDTGGAVGWCSMMLNRMQSDGFCSKWK